MSRFHVRLNRRRWAAVRRGVLDAAGWRCAKCGRFGNQVDHIRPLHRGGGAWSPDNLQVLCRSHHVEKTRRENEKPDPARDQWRALVAELVT